MNIEFKLIIKSFLFVFFIFGIAPFHATAARIKDVATIKGVRDNILIGYGIVVGLKGTGDSSTDVTSQSLKRLFSKLGLEVQDAGVKSKNAAAVIVTAKLPPFSRAGTKIDVTASSIGDAASLEGGVLLVTPLRGGDQNVYAVAQGPVSLGSVADGGGKTFPTVGSVVSGATIEKDVDLSFAGKKSFRLALKNPDFTTAARISHAINGYLGGKFAHSPDSGTVDIMIPFQYEGNSVELVAQIEGIDVNVDNKARVILNERTGTVVMGQNITLTPVAISHGELSIQVTPPTETPPTGGVAPAVASAGGAQRGPASQNVVEMPKGASVSDLVKVLNALGVKPKDLTAIFQTLKRVGALQAELEIM